VAPTAKKRANKTGTLNDLKTQEIADKDEKIQILNLKLKQIQIQNK